MTRGGVKEYIESVQGHYLKGNRKEKCRVCDEATVYHRKAVIRMLGGEESGKPAERRAGLRQYGPRHEFLKRFVAWGIP